MKRVSCLLAVLLLGGLYAVSAEAGVFAIDGRVYDAKLRKYSQRNAYLLAKLSELAYESRKEIRASCGAWGLSEVEYFEHEKQGVFGFIASNKDLAIIVFRGTAKPANVVVDFNSRLQRSWRSDKEPKGRGKIHNGFAGAVDQVWKTIHSFATKRLKGRTLVLCGHSMGGALAALTAYRLDLGKKPALVSEFYTFGQPKLGGEAFRNFMKDHFGDRYCRVVNHLDPVVAMPPAGLIKVTKLINIDFDTIFPDGSRYGHCGRVIKIGKAGSKSSTEFRNELLVKAAGKHIGGFLKGLLRLGDKKKTSLAKESSKLTLESFPHRITEYVRLLK